MKKAEISRLFIPKLGPYDLSNLILHIYRINFEKRIPKSKLRVIKFGLKETLRAKNYISFNTRENLIVYSKELDNLEYQIEDLTISLEKIELEEDDKSYYYERIIGEIIQNFFLDKILYKISSSYIFPGTEIKTTFEQNTKIKLEKHDAIRFSTYINLDLNQFVILFYHSYKLIINPSVDKIIAAGRDVNKLFVVSDNPIFASGEVVGVLMPDDIEYDIELESLQESYIDKDISLKKVVPLIKIRSRRRRMDEYEPSNFYRIQAKSDTLAFFQDLFKSRLKDIQKEIQLEADEYINKFSVYKDELIKYFKKMDLIKKEMD